MGMVVQGAFTKNVQKVIRQLCGESFSESTISEVCREIALPVKQFKERLLSEKYSFVVADALYVKAREDRRGCSKALFIAIGINQSGHKGVIGFDVYDVENISIWKGFFEELKSRRFHSVDTITSDAVRPHSANECMTPFGKRHVAVG